MATRTLPPFSRSSWGPTEATKAVGKSKHEFAERYETRKAFWGGLLEYARGKTRLHAGISPGRYGWIGTGAGRSGLAYNYVVWESESAAELYIDRGKDSDAENKAIFDRLHQKKAEIEQAFGGELEWQRLDAKRACRIRKVIDAGGWGDVSRWPNAYPPMVDAMVRLEAALRPYIQRLGGEAPAPGQL